MFNVNWTVLLLATRVPRQVIKPKFSSIHVCMVTAYLQVLPRVCTGIRAAISGQVRTTLLWWFQIFPPYVVTDVLACEVVQDGCILRKRALSEGGVDIYVVNKESGS